MSQLESPIPLSDIESVLGWVDTFKLSRCTKKINRDFSDAVLLAEILNINYPKLVEMHNYPPRNSHSLKLNNWMTLNRKVLKKLKLSLCYNTMEQLADCAPGVIERVLVMVRDKIRRDEEANKVKEEGMNQSSGGSYYEACGEEEHVLMVPVKTRVNGVLETLQQKVVNFDVYRALKEELKDARDASDVLRQKLEHLDSMIKLKDERIDELQSQLERKQARRKGVEAQQSLLSTPNENLSPRVSLECCVIPSVKALSLKTVASIINVDNNEGNNILDTKTLLEQSKSRSKDNLKKLSSRLSDIQILDTNVGDINVIMDNMTTDVFMEKELFEDNYDNGQDYDEFKDSEQDIGMTIEDSIQNEIQELIQQS